MFVEKRLLFRVPNFSHVESLHGLSSREIDLDNYLESLVSEIHNGSSLQGREEYVQFLQRNLNTEAVNYFNCLDDLELDVDCDDSYFNNLARLYSKVFSNRYVNFENGSTYLLNLETLKSLPNRHNISNLASVYAFDVNGRKIDYLREGTMFESLREFKLTNVGTKKILMEKVVLPSGEHGFVPMFAMIDLGTDFNKGDLESMVSINAHFDFSSMLNLQLGQDFAHRVVTGRGLSLHSALGAGWMQTVSDMNLRSATGEVLSQLDSGSELQYTGAHKTFLINGLPLEFLEVEYATEEGMVRGFVCSLGVSVAKSLDLLPFVDTRFSRRVAEYPTDNEVSDLQTTGLDLRLPDYLKKDGMVLGYSLKFNEYFLYSYRHTLKIAGERMRYLRYRKDYLDENSEREFASFVRKHGDIRGKNGFEFEFESLDDLVHENIFDAMCIRTINDFANEVEAEDKHTLLVSLLNNHHLRFLDKDNNIISSMDLIEKLREFDLETLDRRHMDDVLYLNLFYTGSDSSSENEKIELRALIA